VNRRPQVTRARHGCSVHAAVEGRHVHPLGHRADPEVTGVRAAGAQRAQRAAAARVLPDLHRVAADLEQARLQALVRARARHAVGHHRHARARRPPQPGRARAWAYVGGHKQTASAWGAQSTGERPTPPYTLVWKDAQARLAHRAGGRSGPAPKRVWQKVRVLRLSPGSGS